MDAKVHRDWVDSRPEQEVAGVVMLLRVPLGLGWEEGRDSVFPGRLAWAPRVLELDFFELLGWAWHSRADQGQAEGERLWGHHLRDPLLAVLTSRPQSCPRSVTESG